MSTLPSNSPELDDRIVYGIIAAIVCAVLAVGIIAKINVSNEDTLKGVKLEYGSPGASYRIGGRATSMANRYSGEALEGPLVSVDVVVINKNDYPVSATVACMGDDTRTITFTAIPAHERARGGTFVRVSAGGRYGDTVRAHIDKCELRSVTR